MQLHISSVTPSSRGGQKQLLMFNVSHFLAKQQTITDTEISNFQIHWTLNVYFNCTIMNLKQWVIGVNSALFSADRKLVLLALAAWHNKIIFEILISTCLHVMWPNRRKRALSRQFYSIWHTEQLKCVSWSEQCSFEEQ